MDNSGVYWDQLLKEWVPALCSLFLDPLHSYLLSCFLPSHSHVTPSSSGMELHFCISDFLSHNHTQRPRILHLLNPTGKWMLCLWALCLLLCLNSPQVGLFSPVLLSVVYFSMQCYHLVSLILSAECDRSSGSLWSLGLHDDMICILSPPQPSGILFIIPFAWHLSSIWLLMSLNRQISVSFIFTIFLKLPPCLKFKLVITTCSIFLSKIQGSTSNLLILVFDVHNHNLFSELHIQLLNWHL